jgi:hypothetical protein
MAALLKGWHPDPYGLHELRYFSMDGRPSRLVRDGDVQSSDPPPVDAPSPAPSLPPLPTVQRPPSVPPPYQPAVAPAAPAPEVARPRIEAPPQPPVVPQPEPQVQQPRAHSPQRPSAPPAYQVSPQQPQVPQWPAEQSRVQQWPEQQTSQQQAPPQPVPQPEQVTQPQPAPQPPPQLQQPVQPQPEEFQTEWPMTVHGWHEDPYRLHEDRYFTRGQPTRLVRDGGVESYDEPPGAPPRETRQPSTFTATPSAPATPAAPATPPAPAAPTNGTYAGVGQPSYGAAPAVPQSEAAPAPDDPKRNRRRRRLFGGLGMGALVAIVIAVIVVVGTGGSGSNAVADAAVVNAVNSSLANKTSHVTVTNSSSDDGQTIATTGSGSIDFTTNKAEIALHVNIKGTQLDETAIYDAGVAYEQLPQIAQLLPGKSWVSLDLTALNTTGTTGSTGSSLGSSPIAELRLLALQGNTVTALGNSSINGVSVKGYSVTANPSTINSEIKNANLPDWMKQSLSQVTAASATAKVYVNDSGQLARTSSATTQTVSGSTVTVSQTNDFTDYGAPVSIAIPPMSQVVPFTQFIQKAGQAGS